MATANGDREWVPQELWPEQWDGELDMVRQLRADYPDVDRRRMHVEMKRVVQWRLDTPHADDRSSSCILLMDLARVGQVLEGEGYDDMTFGIDADHHREKHGGPYGGQLSNARKETGTPQASSEDDEESKNAKDGSGSIAAPHTSVVVPAAPYGGTSWPIAGGDTATGPRFEYGDAAPQFVVDSSSERDAFQQLVDHSRALSAWRKAQGPEGKRMWEMRKAAIDEALRPTIAEAFKIDIDILATARSFGRKEAATSSRTGPFGLDKSTQLQRFLSSGCSSNAPKLQIYTPKTVPVNAQAGDFVLRYAEVTPIRLVDKDHTDTTPNAGLRRHVFQYGHKPSKPQVAFGRGNATYSPGRVWDQGYGDLRYLTDGYRPSHYRNQAEFELERRAARNAKYARGIGARKRKALDGQAESVYEHAPKRRCRLAGREYRQIDLLSVVQRLEAEKFKAVMEVKIHLAHAQRKYIDNPDAKLLPRIEHLIEYRTPGAFGTARSRRNDRILFDKTYELERNHALFTSITGQLCSGLGAVPPNPASFKYDLRERKEIDMYRRKLDNVETITSMIEDVERYIITGEPSTSYR